MMFNGDLSRQMLEQNHERLMQLMGQTRPRGGVTCSASCSSSVQVVTPLYDEVDGGCWVPATVTAECGVIEIAVDGENVVIVKLVGGDVQVSLWEQP